MARRIEETVAENRSGRKRLEGYAIEVSSDATRDYTFTGNTVEVQVGIEVYTRPLGNTLIMGHPDAEQGMGRGEMGDNRGAWSLVTSSEESGAFTSLGRGSVVDTLAGNLNGLSALLVGAGTGAASVGDTALESETASTFAYGLKDAPNITRARGQYLFHEFGDTVTEFGVEDTNGDLMARLTTTTVDPTNNQELKVGLTLTFAGDGIGDSVITDVGEAAIADSIQIESETAGIYEVAVGTGTSKPSTSNTSLNNEYDRKRASRSTGPEQVRGYTKWFESEPAPLPVDLTELGMFTFNGNLVWHGTFDAFEKTDAFPFKGGATIRII